MYIDLVLGLPILGNFSDPRLTEGRIMQILRIYSSVITYVLLGSIVGLLSKMISISGYQQTLSIGVGSLFLIGILNGFLPCGFVYMTLATAVTLGGAEASMLFMAGFGFGTIPAMLWVSLAGGLISAEWRQKLQNLSPYFVVFVGVILILRGLNLGIPFISPAL